jgi:electron transfer flavoprotein alpha subunit
MAGILAFAEARDGDIRKAAHEAITAARSVAGDLGAEVHALVIGGPGTAEGAADLGRFGATRVLVAEDDRFAHYDADGYAAVVKERISSGDYQAVVFTATALGKDLAPRVAARLGVDCTTECTALEVEDGTLVATRPRLAGKVFARQRLEAAPAIVTVRPNVFMPKPGDGSAETEQVEVQAGEGRAVVREVKAGSGEKLDVSEASVIVSGGRGLREPDNFKLLEELAGALNGAAVGASRAVVDAGWRPHAEQVGQTGKTVAPTLYFAIGISGAIQHLAGMRTSKTIVAINKDPDAPIFQVADYGIVGDLFEIVPRLTEELRSS